MTAKRDKDYNKNKSSTEIGISASSSSSSSISTSTTTVATTGNRSNGVVTSTQNVSSSQDITKRTNKPLMEKRRRARINQSLAILKALILESTKTHNAKNGEGQTKHTKLEKADILELTVRHFQRHRNLDDPTIDKYRAGYTDCAREVARYLATPEPPPLANVPTLAEPGSKARLLRHLDQCIAEIDIEICPTSTASFADSPSSSCYDINTSVKKSQPDDNSCDYSSQDSNPLDFSKASNGSSASNKPNTFPNTPENTLAHTNISPNTDHHMVQDENNNRDQPELVHESRQLANALTNAVDMNPLQNYNDPNKLCSNIMDAYKHLKVANETNGMLVLPQHYVQLAAALGLNPQTLVDPIATRTDFERLIEMNRVQQMHPAAVPMATGKISPYNVQGLEATHAAAAAAAAYANQMAVKENHNNQVLMQIDRPPSTTSTVASSVNSDFRPMLPNSQPGNAAMQQSPTHSENGSLITDDLHSPLRQQQTQAQQLHHQLQVQKSLTEPMDEDVNMMYEQQPTATVTGAATGSHLPNTEPQNHSKPMQMPFQSQVPVSGPISIPVPGAQAPTHPSHPALQAQSPMTMPAAGAAVANGQDESMWRPW